jgi:serine/threonine protein kinase/Tfp pilus assembly protein PilF
MTAEEIDRFRRMEAIFDAVLEYPLGPERDAFLRRQEATTDSNLLAEVRQLLEDHEAVTAAVPMPPDALPRFGPWQAIRLLGRGGMGEVYLAERADGAFRMEAAVKVAPLALASPDIEERFRRERQFLASLDHPKVARLLDGGGGGSGLPYLVMEFVDGLTIDRYSDLQKLDASSRIGLMRQVLEALIYVHGRGVIHRDLKPSNILVDAVGNAKLLDFGTARLVDASGDGAITKTGVFAFTPDFASPEQTLGKPLTVATDIYSAGVLFYRLLTGRPPYRFTDYSAGAVAQTINHTEPESSGLDRPLDAILLKALRKNPGERYSSAAEMDADLARYLEGQPVRARRPRKLPPIAIVAGVIALSAAAVIGWRFGVRTAAPLPSASIAVLPFTNVGGNPGNQYFSDGVAWEITDALTHFKGLRVTARSWAFQFRGKENDLRNIAKQLNANYVLEGSIERSGDRVKTVASLDRATDGVRIWTNTYQRLAADTSAVEADLETAILTSLGLSASAQPKIHVPPEEAHEYYLKARFQGDQISMAANDLAQQYYRRALKLDPDYAAAYEGLGAAIWNRGNADGEPFQPAEIRKSEELTEKAVQLDPNLVRAYVGLALFAMRYDFDWNRADRELRTALTLSPFTGAELNYANLCLVLGKRQEADLHFQRARDLDSLSSQAVLNDVQYLTVEGRFEEAREEIRKIAARSPTNERLQVRLNFMEAWFGSDTARGNLRNWLPQRPYAREFLAGAEAHNGNRQEALRLLIPLEREYLERHVAVYGLAAIRAALDDEPGAVRLLEKAIDAREDWAPYIHVDVAFAKMQNTPEFHRLKKRMGLDW